MKLLHIDEDQLHALLAQQKENIGTVRFPEFVNFAGGLSLVVTAWTGLSNVFLKWGCTGLGVLLSVLSLIRLFRSFLHAMDAETLYKEIVNLDKVERRSSIVAIRDTYQQYPHRYLLYHDEGWDCDFFPNHASASTNKATTALLSSYLSDQLEIPETEIDIQFVREGTNEKPSTEHGGELRLYTYWLYNVTIAAIPDFWKQDEFVIAGRHYKWMSTDSMLADERIREVNSDVVSLVRDTLS